MILTVTPNPSVDRTLEVGALQRGGVVRVEGARTHPGGKAVNVSRALRRNGEPTTAVLPVGGADGGRIAALLDEQGVAAVTVPIGAATRSNITIAEGDGVTTKLNLPGPALTEDEVDAVLDAVRTELRRGPRWLVAGGSLPAGVPPEFYPRVARLAAEHGVPVAIDTSGAPLEAAARAGGVDLLKPNHEELAELLGRELTTVGDVADAAREVLDWGNGAVLATLGAHGVLLASGGRTWWAGGAAVVPRSTVGAGDCALAGYLHTAGEPEERLRRAVAWGAAAVALPGTTVPGPADIDCAAVRVVADPDPALVVEKL
ncbi:1-phosphofructokinase [Nocardiopsis trehalosi]|jgi:1-phosphofructokinase|uniref:1-phosphofructokinase n=1 Tax=Nocardiopsis trehalosi TaxID=109329 RepID=UPI000829F80E|nr:1-phosphofructokinase [Nocardiopsis trehalosi]